MFKSRVKLSIKGKNISRFIKRLHDNDVEILRIKYNKESINIIIYKKDYEKLMDIKSIYDVSLVEVYGPTRIKNSILRYKVLFISFLLSLIFIIILSNMIFSIDIIDNDRMMRTKLLNELESFGISKYRFKKNFNDIQVIKSNILDKYKNEIEWLEIESVGTKYIVRLEKRIIKDNSTNETKQNIIAKKNGVLKKVVALKGQIIKDVNTYVSKGDVVISGSIYLNDEVKDIVAASGSIYAEVWYNVSIEYPYVYSFSNYTGNEKTVYTLKLFDRYIGFNKFKDKVVEDKDIIKSNILPISLVKQTQKQIINESGVLTYDEAIFKAKEAGIKKMLLQLHDDEQIIEYKILKTNIKEDRVILDMFFSIQENITDYQIIEGVE